MRHTCTRPNFVLIEPQAMEIMGLGGGGGWNPPPYVVDFYNLIPFRILIQGAFFFNFSVANFLETGKRH